MKSMFESLWEDANTGNPDDEEEFIDGDDVTRKHGPDGNSYKVDGQPDADGSVTVTPVDAQGNPTGEPVKISKDELEFETDADKGSAPVTEDQDAFLAALNDLSDKVTSDHRQEIEIVIELVTQGVTEEDIPVIDDAVRGWQRELSRYPRAVTRVAQEWAAFRKEEAAVAESADTTGDRLEQLVDLLSSAKATEAAQNAYKLANEATDYYHITHDLDRDMLTQARDWIDLSDAKDWSSDVREQAKILIARLTGSKATESRK